MIATVIGVIIVTAACVFVVWPLFTAKPKAPSPPPLSIDPASDTALEELIAGYRQTHPACPTCGLRPEPGATFCSQCGRTLTPGGSSALDGVEAPERDPDGDERSG